VKVLVINCGSSSVKYDLLSTADGARRVGGAVTRVGAAPAHHQWSDGAASFDGDVACPTYARALELVEEVVWRALGDPATFTARGAGGLEAVGHRVVHGGEAFTRPTLLDDAAVAAIRGCIPLAPLHNPANVEGIERARQLFPGVPHVAVFDTSFHQTMPPEAYLYGLPYEMYEKHRVRRYGFHGPSHAYVAGEAARLLERPLEALRLVTCHLGNGSSLCAVDGGRSVDTSMGFTPLEGLLMGTRCGDLDPAIVPYLCRTLGKTPDELDTLMNRESGLLGVSGRSRDMRDLLGRAAAGDARAALAVTIYARRVARYASAYAAVLGGVDGIVFTAGIGENSPEVRARVLAPLAFLGVEVDVAANDAARGVARRITTLRSPVAALAIPTNESLQIARDCERLLAGGGAGGGLSAGAGGGGNGGGGNGGGGGAGGSAA
jgi:acetate kinase